MSFHIEQIKSKISASSLIGKKVTLKTRAAGEFVGLCPFHSEHTPSFTVSDNKGFYHCFGCGAHGDIFSFLMESEGYDYKAALKLLANMAGVALPEYKKEESLYHKIFYQILQKITDLYQENLFSLAGKNALLYIKSRGITDSIISQYQLGFAFTSRDYLYNKLREDFEHKDIVRASILAKKEENHWVDSMRGRLIFPIADKNGRVIAFGGRSLDNSQPKYLNSSENPFFEKGKILYGVHNAQQAIYKQKNAIVVEGYMDVLAMASAGINNVVAPLGTSLKAAQIQDMWQSVHNVTICMDGDSAGQKATSRAALEILPHIKVDKSVKFIMLPTNKDPDEVIKELGVNRMQSLVDAALNLSDVLFKVYADDIGYDSPEAKALLRSQLLNLADKIQDQQLRRNYSYYFKDQIFKLSSNRFQAKKKIAQFPSTAVSLLARNPHLLVVFYILLENPSLLDHEDVYEEVVRLELEERGLDLLRNAVLNKQLSAAEFLLKLDVGAERAGALPGDSSAEINRIFKLIQSGESNALQILMRALKLHSLYVVQRQIEAAKQSVLRDASESSLARLNALKDCESDLERALNIV